MINREYIAIPRNPSDPFKVDEEKLNKLKAKGLIPRHGLMRGFVDEDEFDENFNISLADNELDYLVIEKSTGEVFEEVDKAYIENHDNIFEGELNLYEIPFENLEKLQAIKKAAKEKNSIRNYENGIYQEGVILLEDIKPVFFSKCIAIPVSCEVINTDKYGGDARSFGYPVDEGVVTLIKYSIEVSALVEDTIEINNDCKEIKSSLKKPHHSDLIITDGDVFDTENAELLIRYDSEYFYKDKHGYFFKTQYFCYGEPQRVTDESAEIYREVNAEYQKQVKKYNGMMKQVIENTKALKQLQ